MRKQFSQQDTKPQPTLKTQPTLLPEIHRGQHATVALSARNDEVCVCERSPFRSPGQDSLDEFGLLASNSAAKVCRFFQTSNCDELAYAPAIGHPAKLSGRGEVLHHVRWFLGAVENFRFIDPKVYAFTDPQAAVAQVKAEALINRIPSGIF